MMKDNLQIVIEDLTPLQTLTHWSELGWIRRLDSALASFMTELDSGAASSPALLVSAAMLAYFEGHGHTCLSLRELVAAPNTLLGWPQDRQEALDALWKVLPKKVEDWVKQLQSCSAVQSKLPQAQLTISMDEQSSEHQEARPLVLAGTEQDPVLYLRRYWNHEQQVAQDMLRRVRSTQPVDQARARQVLDQLFKAPVASDSNPTSNFDWQKFACAVALRSSLTVITGGPGTGKTYTAARLLALLFAVDPNPQRLRISLAAPTGKAAARLRQSIDKALEELHQQVKDDVNLTELTRRIGAARTLHSLLGASSESRQFRYNASNPLDIDVLIVDESSMVHLEMMSALLQALPAHARLILLGDKDQLDSVEAGAVLGDLTRKAVEGGYHEETVRYGLAVTGQAIPEQFCSRTQQASVMAQQTIMLRESRRFGEGIGQLALACNSGDAEQVSRLLQGDASKSIMTFAGATTQQIPALAAEGRPGAALSYADYLKLVKQWNTTKDKNEATHEAWVKSVLIAFDHFRILCAVNQGEWGTEAVNQSVLNTLESRGLLNTGKTGREWFAGKPIMVTRNDPDLGVFNGDVGVVLPSLRRVAVNDEAGTCASALALRAYFLDGEKLRSVSVSRLAHVETAFAMTVHKSQGSEYTHVALVLPSGRNEHLSRELVYTGITRARKFLTIIEGQAGAFNRAVEQPSSRASGLAQVFESAD